MIATIIEWSIKNRFLVLLLTSIIVGWGLYAVSKTPLDAIPDLSDVQVIIRTTYPGQAPKVVEDQVTYPLATAMLSVPGAETVRGYSFYGDSFVYVLFKDGTDINWARSRVLEYLSQVSSSLPTQARAVLGPDATGVGWIYEYALIDKSGTHDLAQLRALQDWHIKNELKSVPGVSEVATVGGMVKQYQVVLDPTKLRAYNLPLKKIRTAIMEANMEVGGAVVEMGEADYMVRATGYIKGIDDLRLVPVGVDDKGTPILLRDVALIRIGPQMRTGIAELNGEGEVVGGIVVMRFGENALATIQKVKERIAKVIIPSLPKGVAIVPTYDRSDLINRAVATLTERLIEEFIIVALVCAAFLLHLRSAFVAIIALPIGILTAFAIMKMQGINANIMSLGGIAIAIGAMVDAAIVMIENVHKHIEHGDLAHKSRTQLIIDATREVGPPLFYSLLIITLSFLPVFTLEAQEGRLFAPLAFTKTYAMAAAAGLSITLIPVLMLYFVRGRIAPEARNPINRGIMHVYKPFIHFALRRPGVVIGVALFAIISTLWPYSKIGREFMPDLDEGDLLYMPTMFPGISVGKAQQILQQTDRMIKTVPEVQTVFGKIGRAETATDPAPLTMIETTVLFKPKTQWRAGMTMEKLKQELRDKVKMPGLTNAWVMPIRTRIDMLATGIKTPVGIKISGPDLDKIQEIGARVEALIKTIPGTQSAFMERDTLDRYIKIDIKRAAASRYGLNIDDVQEVISVGIGGMNISRTIEGRERFPINIRFFQDSRNSITALEDIPIIAPTGAHIRLADVATIKAEMGSGMIKSENARPTLWVYVELQDRDLGSYVAEAQRLVTSEIKLPGGYSIDWAGQYQYMLRAWERFMLVAPLTIVIIVLLLYLSFRNAAQVAIIIGTLPLSLVGGIWLLYVLDYNFSVAVGVGFIALAGVAIETGVVMLVYLNQSWQRCVENAKRDNHKLDIGDLRQAVIEGALLRVRPKMMTVITIIAGLLPIMIGSGTGSEAMRRIAAPMVGGMISATLLTLVLIPAVFLLWQRRTYKL